MNTPLFDPRLATFLTQLGEMVGYFGNRYYQSKKLKTYDPVVDCGVYKAVKENIYNVQSEISKLIGEDVASNTYDKHLSQQD